MTEQEKAELRELLRRELDWALLNHLNKLRVEFMTVLAGALFAIAAGGALAWYF